MIPISREQLFDALTDAQCERALRLYEFLRFDEDIRYTQPSSCRWVLEHELEIRRGAMQHAAKKEIVQSRRLLAECCKRVLEEDARP